LALTLTPALCATLLKPIEADHQKKGFLHGLIAFLIASIKSMKQF
jgi:multidrug efflux pump subunit AcrB